MRQFSIKQNCSADENQGTEFCVAIKKIPLVIYQYGQTNNVSQLRVYYRKTKFKQATIRLFQLKFKEMNL
jgi:hypothetical protein